MRMGGTKVVRRVVSLIMVVLFFQVLTANFSGCFSAASQLPGNKHSFRSAGANRLGSSLLLPVSGNVYPLGFFATSINIGNSPKPFILDVDTGSVLTWVQCDAPCTGCTLPRERLYKPVKGNIVPCKDPLCAAIHGPRGPQCTDPNGQCDFEVTYADHGSVLGVLVADNLPMHLVNGTLSRPRLTFGCGYDLHNPGPHPPPATAGVLGLGKGKASILSQLNGIGLTQNVIGHCLGGQGGGFLFLGNDFVPRSGITWTPMLSNTPDVHYIAGPAEILFSGKRTGIKGLNLIFDTGSSYTYLSSQIYQAVLNLVVNDLKGKPLQNVRDKDLPVCWKGPKPFRSLHDVRNYFSNFALSFTSKTNAVLQIPPEAYLVVTKSGNVCLGILNGAEAGLGTANILGDISLLDKLVIYDNEKQQIGWASANCNRHPKL